MQLVSLEKGRQGLRACLDTIRMRPCRLCGTTRDGVFARCTERYGEVPPLLVIARGSGNEVALAPVTWDGVGEIGCVNPTALSLVRPSVLVGDDAETEEAVCAAGG